jgi:hypothetical protein
MRGTYLSLARFLPPFKKKKIGRDLCITAATSTVPTKKQAPASVIVVLRPYRRDVHDPAMAAIAPAKNRQDVNN